MKKTHIIALLMIVVGLVIMTMSSNDLSTFSTFAAAESDGSKVKISGQLSKIDPMTYDPEKDPNFFSFYMIDDNNDKRLVTIRESKRYDFERSEKIVVTGRMSGDGVFEATEMLLKCPSKYKEQELALRKQAAAGDS